MLLQRDTIASQSGPSMTMMAPVQQAWKQSEALMALRTLHCAENGTEEYGCSTIDAIFNASSMLLFMCSWCR
jgi:hypothetical protein